MTLSAVAKGKKRAIEETQEHDDPTTSIPSAPVLKKNKSRAETRPCPICNEPIPLRLLGKHAELEAERIDAIIQHIGSEEPYYDERDEPGPSSRGRRSAQKARKSIAPRTTGMDELVEINKTIQAIKRHRKRRHAKLKEMLKEEEDNFTRRDTWTRGTIGGQIVCPVCSETVRGDQGVLEAHVDVCVANESRRLEEARQQELALQRANMEEEWESLSNAGSGLYVGDLPGAGFHRRNRESEDVDEEIDIDGDDEAVYGEQQFTEGDILPVTERRPGDDGADGDVDIENDEEVVVDDSPERPVNGKSVAGPNPDGEASRSISHDDGIEGLGRIHVAIETARKKGDKRAHIAALEAKIKVLETTQVPPSSPTCRICLDPYNEPTLSTGCWHTCCRECWLRCLGSNMQCPICKRITVAGDLRRIYL
ncbi:hypothetical protein CC2G_010264 [Coprinopsis cinerea AmutBmut pab1-1]|nr:hypothetical protein CC2G_010264 [Coprinopsis cinerea AmutBmut pab1-1]